MEFVHWLWSANAYACARSHTRFGAEFEGVAIMPILEFSRLLASPPQDQTAWMQTKNLLAAAKVFPKLPSCYGAVTQK